MIPHFAELPLTRAAVSQIILEKEQQSFCPIVATEPQYKVQTSPTILHAGTA